MVLIWVVAVFGPVLAWLLFRSPGYKRVPLDHPPPGPDWQPTAERFLDPTTDTPIQTWYNAVTGERAYVRLATRNPASPA